MLLPCQIDSYAREGTCEVLSCVPHAGGFEVELVGGPLYPEGGGQPSDHGTVAGVPVIDTLRRGDRLVVRAEAPVPLGPQPLAVDWTRRFDHMQQHTAQHLLTALLVAELGVQTTSFHLGAQRSHIDLSRELLPEEAQRVIDRANEVIREARPVGSRVVDDLENVRSRRLAEGVSVLRVVRIEGIDDNTCGGTHVANTSELQVVVRAGLERVRGGGGRLVFLAGGRVERRLAEVERTLDELHRILSTGELAAAAVKLLGDHKAMERALRARDMELAELIARELAQAPGPVRASHRPGASPSLLQAIAARVTERHPDDLVWLTTEGDFLLVGPPQRVSALREPLLGALDARGGGPPGKLQGRTDHPDLHAVGAAVLGRGR